MSEAPGKPGIEPRWTSSQKSGVGGAISYKSLVWYTLSRGILNEVYFPNLDQPNIRDVQFIVTDGSTFFSEEKRDTTHQTEYIIEGVPAYRCINTCKQGRYRITKRIFTNPHNNSLIQDVQFEALQGKISDYKLYVLLAPHVAGMGRDNDGWIQEYKGNQYLAARRKITRLAMGCNLPFLKASCGYVGSSDGWQDLHDYKYLKNVYDKASGGNIALTGEIDIQKNHGAFTLAIGFGLKSSEAANAVRSTLYCHVDRLLEDFASDWHVAQSKCIEMATDQPEIRKLYRTSTMVLNTHLDKRTQGSVIASLSIPWGDSKGDSDLGGYHLIWPRDLVEIGGGFLAAGDIENARKILYFLMSVQEADGHFVQCMWHDGSPYWTNVQMDETALPILLANALKRFNALDWLDPWPLIEKASRYIVQNGPVTSQDRWEEDGGYTPFSLAAQIAALVVAADFYDEKGLTSTATYLRETADYWNSNIEKWIYAEDTPLCQELGISGHYVRITLDHPVEEDHFVDDMIMIKNRTADHTLYPASTIVSVDALALVRFGLRSADDPKMIHTIQAIDHLLKKETKNGPVWKRYNEDGYGEHEDGSSFDGTGVGRGWPLLTGERAHFELAAGRKKEAKALLETIIQQSGENGMIPEQIWDAADIPHRNLYNGGPSLAAMPLVWAHAEFIKLVRSLHVGHVFDMPSQTIARYLRDHTPSFLNVWRFNHKLKYIDPQKQLRIEANIPMEVKWSFDGWKTFHQAVGVDSGVGMYYVDVDTRALKPKEKCVFTFFWSDNRSWEGSDFSVEVKEKAHQTTSN